MTNVTGDKERPIIFQARNHHGASAGKPPSINASTKGRYSGYFQNEHGEQALFVYDYETQTATLWIGDNGWQNPTRLTDDGQVPEIILGNTERLWLRACWTAATAFKGK